MEEVAGITIPPRATYLRMFVHELERIHSHLLWVGVAAHEIGFDTLFYYVWRDREVVLNMLEEISGNRVNYAWNAIGGVRRDISSDKIPKFQKMLDILAERTKYYTKVATTESTIINRASGVGYCSKADMIRLCGAVQMLGLVALTRTLAEITPTLHTMRFHSTSSPPRVVTSWRM